MSAFHLNDLRALFGDIQFTKAGTYVYKVTETMGGSYPGMHMVEGSKTVTITVKDNNGVLEIEEVTGATKDGTVYEVELTNAYSPAVRTGDDTRMTPYLLVMGVSGLMFLLTAAEYKRRKAKKAQQ